MCEIFLGKYVIHPAWVPVGYLSVPFIFSDFNHSGKSGGIADYETYV
jgi:hypothetical protein